jgi:hypothetical protein
LSDDVNVRGVSTFFLFAIPAVLALAAVWWLAFGQGLHYFKRELSQEQRSAEAVGASALPAEPLKIVITDEKDAAVRVDRVEIDGKRVWLYYKNFGQSRVSDFIEVSWRLRAIDGTVIKSKSTYANLIDYDAPGGLGAGERAEAKFDIVSDPRAVVFEIGMHR